MFDKITEIISSKLGVDPELITENTDLAEELGADSADIVEMLAEIEDEFEITIPDEDVESLKTPLDICCCVEQLI